MVIKDWKKINAGEYILFKKGLNAEIRIIGSRVQIRDYLGVSICDLSKSVKQDKTFKTKLQAFKFSKEYMGKN